MCYNSSCSHEANKNERDKQQYKRLSTMIERNLILDPILYSDKEKYAREVWKYTNMNNLLLLPNFYKRGHVTIENAFHLDHKYSIHQGFNDKGRHYTSASIHGRIIVIVIKPGKLKLSGFKYMLYLLSVI